MGQLLKVGCAGMFCICALGMVIAAVQQQLHPNSSTIAAANNGSGPPTPQSAVKPLGVRLRNKYAASIFTLDITVNSKKVDGGTAPIGKKVRVFDKTRIEGHDQIAKHDLFLMARDGELRLNLAVMSLGEWRYFSAKVDPDPSSELLEVDYDWDVATAAFTIGYGWR